MKTVKTRQIPSEREKSHSKTQKKTQMPFHLQRQHYKQLVVYQKKGHWSQKQKLKYAVFLEYFKERFEIKAKRRFNNIFDLMAIFIKTRNPHQCRSHHQKMQKQKFKIDSILTTTSSKYHPRVYQQLKERYINEIQALQIDEEQNFEKFKERIQKIEMKKNIEREIMTNNKRILRSARSSETPKNQKLKKLIEIKKRQEKQKTQKLDLHRQYHEIKTQKNPQIQEYKVTEKDNPVQKIQMLNYSKAIQAKYYEKNTIQAEYPMLRVGNVNRNQQQFYSRLQKMQNCKKQHLDLAYFHYSQYMKHLGEANRLQFQLMKHSPLQTNNQVFLNSNSSIKFANL